MLAIAEEPDPNPLPRDDGTFLWFVGNDTQYPVIQDALDACSDGDEIVINPGLYVESLEVVRNDVTIRPICLPAGVAPNPTRPHWAEVVFWNPTEGFNNANGYAIRMTGGMNTYVGAPRQITELRNGYMAPTVVVPGEYSVPAGTPAVLTTDVTVYTLGVLGDPWNGAAPNIGPFANSPRRPAIEFWSRSIDNVAVYSTDGQGTFSYCGISSDSGYGGGAILTGDSNSTQFVNCNFNATYANGAPLRLADGTLGPPVNVITIEGGAPQFIHTWVDSNLAGANSDGVILDVGSRTVWNRCVFSRNMAPTCLGTYVCRSGTPNFERCRFQELWSWRGTVYWDSTGVQSPDGMNFHLCNFIRCRTSDLQYGGVAWVDCDDCAGQPPRILFDEVGFSDNQNANISPLTAGLVPPAPPAAPTFPVPGLPAGVASYWTPYDIWTPYFPRFRIGANLAYDAPVLIADVLQGPAGDINGDGVVDDADLEEMHEALGTCVVDTDLNGTIDIDDLLGVLGSYGSVCP
ncbi:MAG: hypothetical protein MK116_13395 [Phycisphaerales bacterium]|nr:hypothetical protein [Phycisphaerales bacterium]